MRKQLAVILVAAMALASCNNVEVVDGVKIQKHEHDDSAAKLKEGDIITFDLVIKNDADSTIKDSRKEGKPLQVRVFSRALLVRLYLNDKLIGEQKIPVACFAIAR